MKAAIYSRKSKFTGKGESIENQIQLCMDYCKNLGITDFLVYEDEGFSAKSTDRPQFKKMMRDCKDKKFEYLVCYRLDRVARNVADFATLIENLNKLEISFVSIKEQFDTSTPMGRAMMYISSVFAQLERETIAERVRDNMYELARTGRWLGGNQPYGFNSKQVVYFDDHMTQRKMYQLEVNKEKMDIVKLMFDKFLSLRSLTQLNNYLNNHDIKGSRGGYFDISSVSYILRNPAYVKSNDEVFEYLDSLNMSVVGSPDGVHGILTYAKNTSTPIAAIAKHEGIIDADKWLEVQNLIEKNKCKAPRASTGKKALLSGFLKCSKCGFNMRVTYKYTNNETIYYYVCGTKKSHGVSRCNCKNVRSDKIEPMIINKIKNVNIDTIIDTYNDLKKDNSKNDKDTKTKAKELTAKIKEKEGFIDTLIMQLARLSDSSASQIIIDKVESINKEISILKNELENQQNLSRYLIGENIEVDLIIDNINKFNEEVETADLEKLRMLLSTIIDNIIWDGDKDIAYINYLGLKKK